MLPFTPTAADHGRTITCRAENVDIPGAAIEDHWKLTVHRMYSKFPTQFEFQ